MRRAHQETGITSAISHMSFHLESRSGEIAYPSLIPPIGRKGSRLVLGCSTTAAASALTRTSREHIPPIFHESSCRVSALFRLQLPDWRTVEIKKTLENKGF
jgi:hypothetical protein